MRSDHKGFAGWYSWYRIKKAMEMSNRMKVEELKKLVTEVHFSSICYIGGIDEVDIKRENGKIIVRAKSMRGHIDEKYSMSQEEWDVFIDKLYDDLHINKWKRSYKPDEWVIIDGCTWELQISVEGGRKRIYRGDNEYPENWDEFESLMRQFGILREDNWDE